MKEIVGACIEKGFLLERDALQTLNQLSSFDAEICQIVLQYLFQNNREKIINCACLEENLEKITLILENIKETRPEKRIQFEQSIEFLSNLFHPSAKEAAKESGREEKPEVIQNGVRIETSYAIPTKKIGVDDFVKYFRNRFMLFRNILQEHSELQNLTALNKIAGQKQNISIIAMVLDKRITKNKNLFLEVEDLTGRANLLVTCNKKDIFEKAKDIVLDDILGFKCSGNNEFLFVNDIIFPDMAAKERKRHNKEEYALFIADLHVGSNKFLEEEFLKFVRWVNAEIGSEEQKEIARRIKYIFVVGDLVDGIGVYPGQEDELAINDISSQYDKVAELFSRIRGDLAIIICPGNHDAVRIAEPQPLLDEKFASSLYRLKNVIFVSNPAMINISSSKDSEGFNVFLYHGYSYDFYANSVDSLRLNGAYKKPEILINFLLKRRHLAPTHASTLYFPYDKKDPLMVQEIPDVFVSAHIHKSAVSSYNKILTISCSCWQSKTPFQEKVGHEPDPCKVPILNLKTGMVNVIDFS